jgi:tetratricopeptide (TPR) repeat protein
MDPDGTLHNIRPIARLDVSGPDPQPVRPADTEFGGKWFSPKPDTDTDTATATATATETQASTPNPAAGQVAESAKATETSHKTQERPAGAKTAENHETEPPANNPTNDARGTLRPSQAAEHVVIDFDVTDLFKAMAFANGQPAEPQRPAGDPGKEAGEDSDDPPTLDAEAVRKRIEQRMLAEAAERNAKAPAPEPEPEPQRPALSAADLEAIRWRLDGGTLREVVDDREALRELGERLDGPLADEVDNVAKAGLLSVRAEVYRLLGELGMAAAASRLALAHAESERDLQSEVIAQAELAHILRLRGDFKEADRLFAKATGADVPDTLRSVVHENAGRSCYDQGRHMEALDHFAKAVRLGRPDDAELAARIGVCLEAVYIHVLRDGWGPYPRQREDILGISAPPEPDPEPKPQREPATTSGPDAFTETTAEQPIVRPRQ